MGFRHRQSLLGLTLAALLVWAAGGRAQPFELPPEAVEFDQVQMYDAVPGPMTEAPSDDKKDDKCPECVGRHGWKQSDWKKVPLILTTPRLGNQQVNPTGPGYYSLMDVVTGTYRQAPPKYGYPRNALWADSFFNADWRYLDDPKNKDFDYLDGLHRIHLGDNWLFSTGGSFWWRHVNEVNSRLSGFDNNYDLFRVRAYGDLCYQDKLRFFVEFIDAQSVNHNLPPLIIDRNYGDFLNGFVDVKVCEIEGQNVYVRGGRQELLLGSQRLISPLEWANTRRTFSTLR